MNVIPSEARRAVFPPPCPRALAAFSGPSSSESSAFGRFMARAVPAWRFGRKTGRKIDGLARHKNLKNWSLALSKAGRR
jgi:hypothetical protein